MRGLRYRVAGKAISLRAELTNPVSLKTDADQGDVNLPLWSMKNEALFCPSLIKSMCSQSGSAMHYMESTVIAMSDNGFSNFHIYLSFLFTTS